jgi:hypothetical protein
MADVTLTVRALTKVGVLDLAADTYMVAGNAAAGADFLFPNDGKTFLLIDGAGAGTTWTFTPKADKYGRTEALAKAVASGKWAAIGPFLPELWNDPAGMVHFVPTLGSASDLLLAVRVANPT